MRGRTTVPATMLAALIAAGCGGGGKTTTTTVANKQCAASVGIEAPISGRLGAEQLAFAKLAIADDNRANGTNISLVQGDTGAPSAVTSVTRRMISTPQVVGVVGPAKSREVEAVGPLFGRAGLAFISGSAAKTSLTSGLNPTFFRVVSSNAAQGPETAQFIVTKLHPKAVMIIDDQSAYSTGLVSTMIPILRAARITVYHQSVSPGVTNLSSVVAKITPQTTVAILPWQAAADAERFGKDLAQQHRKVTIVGTDRLYSPSSFTIPGSYVSSLGPDIRLIPADASLVRQAHAAFPKFGTVGPPVYAATHVIDEAIASVCKSGQTPARSNVLGAIKATDEPSSILDQPIQFTPNGDLVNAKWFVFRISSARQYQLVHGA